jgi:diguanylate cyclase (GGDEF)-like protein
VHQATHDGLTGLPNRTLLRDRLDQALLRGRADATVALLFLGLNRFKNVNDSLGHEVGDRVLLEVAERLSTALRPGDTLARFSGDEFVVLCEDLPDEPTRIAARLQRSLEEPFRGPTSDIVLRAAIGITVAHGPHTNPERLLREAASAMAQAKATARPWWVFDEELQSRATKRLQTEHALQQALEREELLVHYQPLLDVAAGRIVAAEALVRWRHPERGLVPPMDFIPLAEETGQIADIWRFVLARACRQAAAWAAAGRPIRVSVNISVDQLRQGDLPEDVQRELLRSQLPPERLCLEITESSLIREAGQGFGDLTRLRDLGVQLSIDDFGTGYSSLSYLHQLPVDELKIDRSFISQLGRGTRESHLVEAITVMARALGLGVVAEGVETPGQLEYLAEVGCQLAQGYLIARPQPPEQILGLLPRQSERLTV